MRVEASHRQRKPEARPIGLMRPSRAANVLLLRQNEPWLIEPLREHNDFAGQLRDALDSGGEFLGRGAKMRERLLHAWAELSRGAFKFCDLCQSGLVVDRVLAVQREQD